MKNEAIRVQKLIAQAGVCSRRDAEQLITSGKVKINGKIAQLGDKAFESDNILVNNKPILSEEKEYYLVNKPRNCICTVDDKQKRKMIIDLVPSKSRLYPVGRLDYNTTGAIIVTNDGALCHKLTHPSFEVDRVYNAEISTPLSIKELNEINQDLMVNNQVSQHEIIHLYENFYQIKLHQGSNHHVKKIFEQFNREVINLHRISYSFINVNNMALGQCRALKPFEIKKLKALNNPK